MEIRRNPPTAAPTIMPVDGPLALDIAVLSDELVPSSGAMVRSSTDLRPSAANFELRLSSVIMEASVATEPWNLTKPTITIMSDCWSRILCLTPRRRTVVANLRTTWLALTWSILDIAKVILLLISAAISDSWYWITNSKTGEIGADVSSKQAADEVAPGADE